MPTPADLNRRILIVDDTVSIHEDFQKILAAPAPVAGKLADLESAMFDEPVPDEEPSAIFSLASAYQGQDARDRVLAAREAGAPYAMAFVDMRMPPGWDGLETIDQLWQVDPDLQIVICSAYSDYSWGDFRKRLGERDALLILKKPFDTIEVLQCAHALTSKWNLARLQRARLGDLEGAVHARTLELVTTNDKLAAETRLRDRVEAELRLAQKLEAVGQLAAGIAHEINSPIQFVGTNLQFLRESVTDILTMANEMRAIATGDPRHAEILVTLDLIAAKASLTFLAESMPEAFAEVLDGVDRVASIVKSMKELVHPGHRDASPADLNRAVENSLKVSASAYRYIAALETDLAPLPMVVCHVGELNQVFLNLIGNAAHAIEDRKAGMGRIRITSRVDRDHVVIEIADTGCGIPEAIRERVFDGFFTTKAVGRGTGQGLAIARAIIVDRHEGELTFTSELGVGTTFQIRLPITGAQHASRNLQASA